MINQNAIIEDGKSVILDYLHKSRLQLEEDFLHEVSGKKLNHIVTKQYDYLIKSLYEKHALLNSKICLIALGGYGRCEMAPYSDVDLMLLYEESDAEFAKELINKITYPLWDSGVEICGVTRTIDDCLKVASQDIRSLTSMMDARLLIGNRELFNKFQYSLLDFFTNSRRQQHYVRAKFNEHERRLKRYGDSVFVSEPHLKEGEGGLRCYHTAIWVAKARYGADCLKGIKSHDLISKKSFQEIEEAIDLLWKLRHGLHLISKRKLDRLDYDHQEVLAKKLIKAGEDEQVKLETLMHDFYRSASRIHQFSDRIIGTSLQPGILKRIRNRLISKKLDDYIYRLGDKVHISSRAKLGRYPETALRAWLFSHRLKLPLDAISKEAIRTAVDSWSLTLVDDNGEVRKIFKEIVFDPIGLDKVFLEMHETGAIIKFIPEFESLYHRVQYDAYHIYTVDIHTIFTIREVSNLFSRHYKKEFPYYDEVVKDVLRPDILVMATLLHDIGKNGESGGRHDHTGAKIAREIMSRFRYSKEDQELVEFLVESHLILPQVAFCRDTADSLLIENLANAVKTTDTLLLLHLLTFADIRATGTEIWSSWKGELLTNLYNRTSDLLSGRGYTSKKIDDIIEKKAKKACKLLKDGNSDSLIEWLKHMPVNYLLNTSSDRIADHFVAKQKLKTEKVTADFISLPNQQFDELMVVTTDAPGLFARICRVLTMNSLSILDAHIYTDEGGHVIDLFRVVNQQGNKVRPTFDWNNTLAELKSSIIDGADLLAPIPLSHSTSTVSVRHRKHGYKFDVLIDNDVSAYYTVVEIHAPDQVGLLYKVAYWLYTHGYDISTAKAMTHVGQAIDVFYIKTREGDKVSAKSELKDIKAKLVECLQNN